MQWSVLPRAIRKSASRNGIQDEMRSDQSGISLLKQDTVTRLFAFRNRRSGIFKTCIYIYIDAFLLDAPTPSRFLILRIRMDIKRYCSAENCSSLLINDVFILLPMFPNSSFVLFSCSFLFFFFFHDRSVLNNIKR